MFYNISIANFIRINSSNHQKVITFGKNNGGHYNEKDYCREL